VLVPSAKVAGVTMVNADNSPTVDELTQAILDDVLPGGPDDHRSSPGRRPGETLAPPSNLTKLSGTWRGRVETHQGQLALMLRFKEPGDVHVRLGEQLETLLNGPKLEGDELTGGFQGVIGPSCADTQRDD